MAEPDDLDVRLLRSDFAASPRTMVDILRETAAMFPDDPAIDNGAVVRTYGELVERADEVADHLADMGVGPGSKVGVRVESGTVDLYVAILGTILAGASYVPVDADDPDARARVVFDEAGVAAVIGSGLVITARGDAEPVERADPALEDDVWVIFTSGSTGTPKGVAVSHRSAAAFVDAESRMFLLEDPIGPGDRVMAGLSVAFDASCEEMWLAWRYGACLVPAPRSLVRSGTDLGPWMVANAVTIVSTVPTLVALWPAEAMDAVRLLILGGEACPPEIGARLARPGREVWNTYGPTETTVVACGAQLTTEPPVRIGMPLDGWDLAVVDEAGHPVPQGEPGQLIIGGVGLARYLDAEKDAATYAPMPTLGWDRAYRSGDRVVFDGTGLVFVGRGDEQIKIGGRRIELGEIDGALLQIPEVSAAAAAVRTTESGNTILIGYVSTAPGFDIAAAAARLRASMPAAMVPRLAVVDTLPTRTSGKIDREALPWPLPQDGTEPVAADAIGGTAARISESWRRLLGSPATSPTDDFFALGGGSLTAAQLVAELRAECPELTVADVYEHPRLADLAAAVERLGAGSGPTNESVRPVPIKTQAGQVAASVLLRSLGGLRWVTWIAVVSAVLSRTDAFEDLPAPHLAWTLAGLVLLVFPPGRMLLAAGAARFLLHGVGSGEHPRGGKVHLRLWLAERIAEELGAASLSGVAAMTWYARLLGAEVGRGVDLHTVPPITGMLTLGDRAAIEPEVDLSGHWVDGNTLHLGHVHVGADARVGARSMLAGGARVGKRAEVAPGSVVFDRVRADEYWSGAPAVHVGTTRGPAAEELAPRRRVWLVAYALSGPVIALLPVLAVLAGFAVALPIVDPEAGLGSTAGRLLALLPLVVLVGFVVLCALVLALVRIQSVGLVSGVHPVHGRRAWQAWTILRVLDEARTWLFPLYSSTLTPTWLRWLGARIGPDVEASTVLMLPNLTVVNQGAFLADDTMLGMYELGGGWLRIERVKIGRHAFVGNSGMTAPGRKVPKDGLVAVLSAAPRRSQAKAGTSWIGSPPARLPRSASDTDTSRTFEPPTHLRWARAGVEAARIVPLIASAALAVGIVAVVLSAADRAWWLAVLVAGPALVAAGALAAALSTAAKWVLVGRVRAEEHPLWSGFVWRNELADTFVEVVAAPWFVRSVVGTPILTLWLRSMGAKIGRGVWCETYWLPEPDLIELRDGSTVGRGCVVQTHLFHDRILSMDTVTLRTGATLGPHSVVLPASSLGRHATIGPMSLVMRGEVVPHKTRWIGNPIGPWAGVADPSKEHTP